MRWDYFRCDVGTTRRRGVVRREDQKVFLDSHTYSGKKTPETFHCDKNTDAVSHVISEKENISDAVSERDSESEA